MLGSVLLFSFGAMPNVDKTAFLFQCYLFSHFLLKHYIVCSYRSASIVSILVYLDIWRKQSSSRSQRLRYISCFCWILNSHILYRLYSLSQRSCLVCSLEVQLSLLEMSSKKKKTTTQKRLNTFSKPSSGPLPKQQP